MRFIPTGVGNSGRRGPLSGQPPVHPHRCGELSARLYIYWPSIGSSPQVWGTRLIGNVNSTPSRFIPTGVGNSIQCTIIHVVRSVHPHRCGELAPQGPVECIKSGSSPQVWGTQKNMMPRGNLYRFIPTGVGNSVSFGRRHGANPVHPHRCGELSNGQDLLRSYAGSSPQVWGTH